MLAERQEFEQPRILAHDVDNLIHAVGEIEQRELGQRRIETRQPAHRFIGTAIRRTQHQQTAVRQLLDPLPKTSAQGLVREHRARHQTAHGMRHEVHGLLLALHTWQPVLYLQGKFLRGFLHRISPVVAEHLDPVRAREELE